MPTGTVAGFCQVYAGNAGEVAKVRHDVAAFLGACPVADDAVLCVSELASNSVLHSRSRLGRFTVRAELHPDYVWCEVEDAGGPWRTRLPDPERPHGLDIVTALAGPDNWGTELSGEHDRVTWVRLSWGAVPAGSD